MRITLLEHTPNAEVLVATAAHVCVSDDSMVDFFQRLATKHPKHSKSRFTRALDSGHTSILEHVSFSFAVEGVSRSLSHQLVRFRIASFTQQSQRYTTPAAPFAHVIPPTIQSNIHALELFEEFMVESAELYEVLVRLGVPAEDARFVRTNADCTKLLMTMNGREIVHACALRECTHAQWEIRAMFNEVHRLVEEVAPAIFRGRLGPPCQVTGRCPEGSRCCGKTYEKTPNPGSACPTCASFGSCTKSSKGVWLRCNKFDDGVAE